MNFLFHCHPDAERGIPASILVTVETVVAQLFPAFSQAPAVAPVMLIGEGAAHTKSRLLGTV